VNIAPHHARRLPRPLPPRPLSPSAEPSSSLLSPNPALRPLWLSGKALSGLHGSQLMTRSPRPSQSWTNLAERTSSISFTSFYLRTLELSCDSFSHSRPLFSMACALFDKNTRGGIPPRPAQPLTHSVHSAAHYKVDPAKIGESHAATIDHVLSALQLACSALSEVRRKHQRTAPRALRPPGNSRIVSAG
jgi:hypothetical protein